MPLNYTIDMVKVIDFVLYMFYHSSKNTNSVNQSIEVFSFVLDLQQMGGGQHVPGRRPPPPTRLPLSSWTVRSGGMKEGDILKEMGPPPVRLSHPAPSLCTQPYFSPFP